MATRLTAEDVLRRTEALLQKAVYGSWSLRSPFDPDYSREALQDVVVYGRSVTLVLQNLRTVDRDAFNKWYAPIEKQLGDDPLFRYFNQLRNSFLKEGRLPTWTEVRVTNFTEADIPRRPALGAKSFFIGENFGGAGWIREGLHGAVRREYVVLPDSVMKTTMRFSDAPAELGTDSVFPLVRAYASRLVRLVAEARARFVPAG